MPDTGGSNVPALNNLLSPYNISFGDLVVEGGYNIDQHEMYYASGTSIVRFPDSGLVITETLKNQGRFVYAVTVSAYSCVGLATVVVST